MSRLSLYFSFSLLGACGGVDDEASDPGSETGDGDASGGVVDFPEPVSTGGTGETSSGGTVGDSGGSSAVGGSTGGETAAGGATGGTSGDPITLRVMSLNVYGHMTMPEAAPTYAALIEGQNVDVVGIQEGVHDWQLDTDFPTDYSRAEALEAALGDCYTREYQIFVNTCRGNTLDSHERFDLTDGPNATRTGEAATVTKGGKTFGFIDVHWDHESNETKDANAGETAAAVNAFGDIPVVVLGDFNAGCSSEYPNNMSSGASLDLIVDGGIDCIFSKSAPGSGMEVDATPSDHDAVVAELTL